MRQRSEHQMHPSDRSHARHRLRKANNGKKLFLRDESQVRPPPRSLAFRPKRSAASLRGAIEALIMPLPSALLRVYR